MRAFAILLLLASPAIAADKCRGAPDKLTAEWVKQCEAYYRSSQCVWDMQAALPKDSPTPSKFIARFCTTVVDRIDLFKASQQTVR